MISHLFDGGGRLYGLVPQQTAWCDDNNRQSPFSRCVYFSREYESRSNAHGHPPTVSTAVGWATSFQSASIVRRVVCGACVEFFLSVAWKGVVGETML